VCHQLTIGNQISEFSVPADGTGLPNFKGSGDFGTSPFYGQLPGQVSFISPMRTNMAHRAPKHNEGFKYFKYWLVRVEPAERQVSWGAVSWLP
jgi:hypothetical protein